MGQGDDELSSNHMDGQAFDQNVLQFVDPVSVLRLQLTPRSRLTLTTGYMVELD